MAWASVRLSVRPSVRHTAVLYSIKSVRARITKSLTWDVPKTLVFCDEISCRWVGVPFEGGRQSGVPPKRRYFAAWLVYSVKTIADRYRHAAYHNKHWWQVFFRFINIDDTKRLNDLEPSKKFLVNFSQFLAAAHISTLNCDEMAEDRPRQPAYEIFSIKRRF